MGQATGMGFSGKLAQIKTQMAAATGSYASASTPSWANGNLQDWAYGLGQAMASLKEKALGAATAVAQVVTGTLGMGPPMSKVALELQRFDIMAIKGAAEYSQGLRDSVGTTVTGLQHEAEVLRLVNEGWAKGREQAELILQVNKAYPAPVGLNAAQDAARVKALQDGFAALEKIDRLSKDSQRRYSDQQLSNRLSDMDADLQMRRRIAMAPASDRNLIYGQSQLDKLAASVRPDDRETIAKINALRNSLPDLERVERMSSVFDQVGSSFGTMAGSMVMDIRNVDQALQTLLQDIARLAIQKSIEEPVANWISGGLKSFYLGPGGSTLPGGSSLPVDIAAEMRHGGGRIGSGGPYRWTDSALFDSAPRLHRGSGIAPDERAVIMKVKELAVPEDQVARAVPMGHTSAPKIVVHVHNETGADVQVPQESPQWDGSQWVFSMWVKANQENPSAMTYTRSLARGPI
jgi:hypothetical protein